MMNSPRISVNARAAALIERLRADPAEFRVAIDKGELGETRIDAGSRCQGSIAAGLSLAQICMGGLNGRDHGQRRHAELAMDAGRTLLASGHGVPCQPIRGLEIVARRRQGSVLRARL